MTERPYHKILLGIRPEDREKYVSEEWLEEHGTAVHTCTNGVDAVRRAFVMQPDLIVLDVQMPKLNGYQCAKVLKKDPRMRLTPIVLTGSTDNPLAHYWTKVCQAEHYLPKPLTPAMLTDAIRMLAGTASKQQQVLLPDSIIPELDDQAILTLANNLLEKDYLSAHILNEINLIDSDTIQLPELVGGIFSIIHSLFDFKVGAALLVEESNGELLIYPDIEVTDRQLENIRRLILAHVRSKHDLHLKPRGIRTAFLKTASEEAQSRQPEHLFIHTPDSGPVRSALAFDGLDTENLEPAEMEILSIALQLSHRVIDRKIYYQLYRKLSLIDSSTEGYSLSFFMTVLLRELENAKRNRYPVAMFTFTVSAPDGHSDEITREINRILSDLILKVMRKSDIVARWDPMSFAFLMSHTPLEKAHLASNRIVGYIRNHLERQVARPGALSIRTGIAQFDPDTDRTPEQFFGRAKPAQGNTA